MMNSFLFLATFCVGYSLWRFLACFIQPYSIYEVYVHPTLIPFLVEM